MTCGKCEGKGKHLSFRQQAKEWIGRILGEEFCRPVGCETQFGAAEKTEAEKWELRRNCSAPQPGLSS